ncbi:MAG: hypothetical protein LBP34_04555 [Flavobacteriaceae bacterium]|nr:hypothetical protein [Flavobacteriaceae bacterium]
MIKNTCAAHGFNVFSPAFQAGRVVVYALRKSSTFSYESIAFQANDTL